MRAAVGLIVALTVFSAACSSPAVDLTKGLQINVVSSGWQDAGLVNGLNKLAPQISFTLKNVSDQTLASLQVNALFRRVTEKDEWGSGFVTVAGSQGLPSGATSEAATITSQHGYTGSEPRLVMMTRPQFVDAKVELFAKYGSGQWTRLGEFPIERRLIEK